MDRAPMPMRSRAEVSIARRVATPALKLGLAISRILSKMKNPSTASVETRRVLSPITVIPPWPTKESITLVTKTAITAG